MTEKKKVIENYLWRLGEKGSVQVLSFIVSIILARLLDPSLYGSIAIIIAFIAISNVFVDGGMASALIQKKEVDEKDYSSAFYCNIILCIIIYTIIFLLAPLAATFYNDANLTAMIRVLAATILISGVKNVQIAYISRNMLFRTFFWSTLIGTLISSTIAILMAYKGFGVWALIVQQLVNNFIDTVCLWVIVGWKPIRYCSLERVKTLASFGCKILCINFVEALFSNARSLIIGKVYNQTDLAYYNRGEKFADVVAQNVSSSLDSILFPVMSKVQNDKSALKALAKRSNEISTYIISPLLLGMAFSSETIIRVLLTEKWMEAKFFLQIFCVIYLFYPIHSTNINVMKAMGKGKALVVVDIVKRVVFTVLLLASLWISPKAIAISMLLTNICSQIINSYPNKKFINYGYFEQIKDILPNIFTALIMGLIVFGVGLFSFPYILKLLLQVVVGMMTYIVISALTRNRSFYYLINLLKKRDRMK